MFIQAGRESLSVVLGTGPLPVFSHLTQLCPERMALDIPRDHQKLLVGLHGKGFESGVRARARSSGRLLRLCHHKTQYAEIKIPHTCGPLLPPM